MGLQVAAERDSYVRLKLKSGVCVAGVFGMNVNGDQSWASAYPEKEDLYLSEQLQIHPATGAWVRNSSGVPDPVVPPTGTLLRWEEVEFLEIQEY